MICMFLGFLVPLSINIFIAIHAMRFLMCFGLLAATYAMSRITIRLKQPDNELYWKEEKKANRVLGQTTGVCLLLFTLFLGLDYFYLNNSESRRTYANASIAALEDEPVNSDQPAGVSTLLHTELPAGSRDSVFFLLQQDQLRNSLKVITDQQMPVIR